MSLRMLFVRGGCSSLFRDTLSVRSAHCCGRGSTCPRACSRTGMCEISQSTTFHKYPLSTYYAPAYSNLSTYLQNKLFFLFYWDIPMLSSEETGSERKTSIRDHCPRRWPTWDPVKSHATNLCSFNWVLSPYVILAVSNNYIFAFVWFFKNWGVNRHSQAKQNTFRWRLWKSQRCWQEVGKCS